MAEDRTSPRPAAASGARRNDPAEIGWPVLHLFYRIDRTRWRALADGERGVAVREFSDFLGGAQAEEGLQLVPIAFIGKADFGLMAIHPDLRRIQRLGQECLATTLGSCLEPVYSFLSISEKSEYISTPGDHARKLIDEDGLDPESPEFRQQIAAQSKRMAAYAAARVHPRLPGQEFPVLCFYPMSKLRGEGRNWYALPFNERKRLMGSHADAGRRFADRVTQLITSSTGLDDWEWGVTLFTRELKAIRDIVYEMRYDEGSALYGQFGPFYVGIRFAPEELGSALRL